MTLRSPIARISEQETLNFLLTNRVPRRILTRFMGWFSKIEQPIVRDLSMAAWRLFSDLDLSDAKKTEFRSLHDCFVRELREGARPINGNSALLTSPCDAIVGASGTLRETTLLQVKGFPYTLEEFLGEPDLVEAHRDGHYVTLRLTASMYHRFHAPCDCRVERVTHIPGDAWNVNPVTLKRVDRVFCRNERAVLKLRTAAGGHTLTMVTVAAILVAGIRLRFMELPSERRFTAPWTGTPRNAPFSKGEEMGWFEHGSTIVVLAPAGFQLCNTVVEGAQIRMGEPLMIIPSSA